MQSIKHGKRVVNLWQDISRFFRCPLPCVVTIYFGNYIKKKKKFPHVVLCKNTDRCSFLSFIWPASPIRPSVDASALHFIILACFLVTTLGDLQLQSSASGWKYGFSISLWFCHKFSSRKSERAMGRRAVQSLPWRGASSVGLIKLHALAYTHTQIFSPKDTQRLPNTTYTETNLPCL